MNHRQQPNRRTILAGAAGLAAASAAPAWAVDDDALADKGYAVGDIMKGDPAAQVTIIEYASLTCPHCASFHVNSYPTIKRDYIDTGKANLIIREIYFDQFGLWAAMVARCGGEEGYYKLIDMYLERQGDWWLRHRDAFAATKNPQPVVNEIMKIGRLAGLSNERMNACLSDQAFMERLVTDYRTTSSNDNIRSTPTFIINGETLNGAVSAATMAAEIEKHL